MSENAPDAQSELQFLLGTPAEELLANHYFVLAQWAAVHLASTPADLAGAQLIIDVMGAMLDTGQERLGTNLTLYRSALAEIQQVFVRATLGVARGPSEGESAPDAVSREL